MSLRDDGGLAMDAVPGRFVVFLIVAVAVFFEIGSVTVIALLVQEKKKTDISNKNLIYVN